MPTHQISGIPNGTWIRERRPVKAPACARQGGNLGLVGLSMLGKARRLLSARPKHHRDIVLVGLVLHGRRFGILARHPLQGRGAERSLGRCRFST
jgi:hypothetical protein